MAYYINRYILNYNYNILTTVVRFICFYMRVICYDTHTHIIHGITRFDLTLAINRCRASENAMERFNRNGCTTTAPELNPRLI